MKRPVRTFAAVLALAAVLFSQLAVAAYACPGADGMAIAAAAAPEAPPCHEQEPADDPSALCQAHCQQVAQSLDKSGASVPQPALACVRAIVTPAAAVPAAVVTPASLLERPTGPPLSVRHCCLRI